MKMKNSLILSLPICLAFSSIGHAVIVVENFATDDVPTAGPQDSFELTSSFDVGAGDLLVVGVSFEGGATDSTLSFAGGPAITPTITSNVSGDQTAIFVFSGVSGLGALQFDTTIMGTPEVVNFPGFYAASLSGALGVEASGQFSSTTFGPLSGTISGTSAGSYVLAIYADQLGANQTVDVTGDLSEVSVYGNASGDVIGSAVGSAAEGFSTGADLSVTFSDSSNPNQNNAFQNRSNFSFVSIEAVPEPSAALLGAFGLLGLLRRRR